MKRKKQHRTNKAQKHDVNKQSPNAKYMVLSALSALFILCVNYLLSNSPYPIFDNIDFYSKQEFVRRTVTDEAPQDTNVRFINVAYDKTLVSYNDSIGDTIGNIDIVDRHKLYRFLKVAKQCNNYKYIFLDVRFEKGYEDNSYVAIDNDSITVDSLLFGIIRDMPRLVVSTHSDITLQADSIASKTAINDYMSTITATNFVRYRYLYDQGESVALRMYKDINGGTLEKHGLIYTLNGDVCTNCPFVSIEQPFKYNRENLEEVSYYNLGTEILNEEEFIKERIRDKYVIISDCIEDVHDTYVGPQPGAYLTYLAYKELASGKNIIHWWMIVLFGLIYGLATFFALSNVDIWSRLPYIRKIPLRTVRFLLTFVGFTLCISAISICLYCALGITLSIWFPSLFFTIVKTTKLYKKS